MGEIFFTIFKTSFIKIKLRFLEPTEIFKTIQSIASIATPKATFFNVTNTSTDLLILKILNNLFVNSERPNLIDITLAFYQSKIFT